MLGNKLYVIGGMCHENRSINPKVEYDTTIEVQDLNKPDEIFKLLKIDLSERFDRINAVAKINANDFMIFGFHHSYNLHN